VVDGDRRRFAREPCLVTVHLRIGTQIFEGTLVNISEDGAFMAIRRTVQDGTEVQVRFRHPWTDQAVTARAMVMRNVAQPGLGGPDAGIGLALLDTLTDLEENQATTSGSFPQLQKEQVEMLRAKARERAALQSSRFTPDRPIPIPRQAPAPADSSKPARPARHATPALQVLFHASGRRNSYGTLGDISAGGLQVLCDAPPEQGRLVRLEIVEGSGQPNLRIAGRVTWANEDAEGERPRGFGVRILHFLSAADERRFASFLIELKERARVGGTGG